MKARVTWFISDWDGPPKVEDYVLAEDGKLYVIDDTVRYYPLVFGEVTRTMDAIISPARRDDLWQRRKDTLRYRRIHPGTILEA